MNTYIFTDETTKTDYIRVTKAQARKAYNNGESVILCACNLRPFGFYRPQCEINLNDYLKYGFNAPFEYSDGTHENDFKKRVNDFEYYNCTNSETGLYTAFYLPLTK